MSIESREWKAYQELRKRIKSATAPDISETPAQRSRRIKKLKNNPIQFFKYYFPHYIDSDFAWFHKKAIRALQKDPNIFLIAEWPRGHAKSVFFDVMVPLWLLAREELTGMILSSANEDKAKGLLGDIQAELESNFRFAQDYGQQNQMGSWSEGYFVTAQGVPFWAFGISQNPAGVREAEKRPNYAVVDDADDKRKAKNLQRVKEDADWVLGEFFGCLDLRAARKVYANNRVHQAGLTAHMVGDVTPEDPKRKGTCHIKVFATEDPKTRKALMPDAGGAPSWPERYTLEMLKARMDQMGYRNTMRQYYHTHIEEGDVFTEDMINWGPCPRIDHYDELLSYNDPSWKSTKKNDFKSIVLIGKKGVKFYIHWCWLRQTTVSNMVAAHYRCHEMTPSTAEHYIEAGLMQDQHMEHYHEYGEERGLIMPIRPDNRKKPDKLDRIASLEPLMQQGLLIFNEKYRKDPDMLRLVNQFMGFPHAHDDGPDATEGGIWILSRRSRSNRFKARMGNYKRNSGRRL